MREQDRTYPELDNASVNKLMQIKIGLGDS